MLTGSVPFTGGPNDVLYDRIINDEIVYPDFLKEESVSLLKHILVRDPDERYTLDQILADPWLGTPEFSWLENMIYDDLTTNIDVQILQEMEDLEYDTRDVPNLLSRGVFNDTTACYRILRICPHARRTPASTLIPSGTGKLKPLFPGKTFRGPKAARVTSVTSLMATGIANGRKRSYQTSTSVQTSEKGEIGRTSD
jgi:serine/threonine protein kinase